MYFFFRFLHIPPGPGGGKLPLVIMHFFVPEFRGIIPPELRSYLLVCEQNVFFILVFASNLDSECANTISRNYFILI
jgi:hypothetical protein